MESWLDKVKWTSRPGARDRPGNVDERRADARMDEPRVARKDRGDRRGALLVALARASLEKGEQSGNVQTVHEIRLDCDEDVVLLKVEQGGGIACHTGRHSCFFQKLENGRWVAVDPVIRDPKEMYGR